MEQAKYGPRNPHPRGMIGEMIANKLIDAGWYEIDGGSPYHEKVWTRPVDPGKPEEQAPICTLEQAHEQAFGYRL